MPYPIPLEIDPENSVCIMVLVPDDPNHIAAFWGALQELSFHWNWESAAPGTTSPTSMVWQRVIRNAHFYMGDCNMHTHAIRQTDCKIELLIDGVVVSAFELDAEQCGLLNGGGEGTKVIAPGATDEDKKTELFSGAMALVIYAQEAIIDVFNALEVAIEIGKAASLWLETVPGLDLSPAYEILQAVDSFNEMLESVFETTDTPEWREAMSCKIMCWCVANEYTFDASVIDKWREYLNAKGVIPPDVFYSQFADVASYKALIDRFSLGMNDDNEDWIILCDSCLKFFGAVTFDDTEDLEYEILYGAVTPLIGNPDFGLLGLSWFEAPWSTGRRASIRVDLGENVDVKAVSFQFNYTTSVGGQINREIRLLDSLEVELDNWQQTSTPTKDEWLTEEHLFTESDVRYVEVECKFNSDYTGAQHINIDNIIVYQEED